VRVEAHPLLRGRMRRARAACRALVAPHAAAGRAHAAREAGPARRSSVQAHRGSGTHLVRLPAAAGAASGARRRLARRLQHGAALRDLLGGGGAAGGGHSRVAGGGARSNPAAGQHATSAPPRPRAAAPVGRGRSPGGLARRTFAPAFSIGAARPAAGPGGVLGAYARAIWAASAASHSIELLLRTVRRISTAQAGAGRRVRAPGLGFGAGRALRGVSCPV
jgi:hypothetical protein